MFKFFAAFLWLQLGKALTTHSQQFPQTCLSLIAASQYGIYERDHVPYNNFHNFNCPRHGPMQGGAGVKWQFPFGHHDMTGFVMALYLIYGLSCRLNSCHSTSPWLILELQARILNRGFRIFQIGPCWFVPGCPLVQSHQRVETVEWKETLPVSFCSS